MGEERIAALLQESLSVAVKTGAMEPQDTRRVIVDTTVQPKNVMFLTDAGVPSKYDLDGLSRQAAQRAREWLVRLAKKTGLDLRQSYVRVGKKALIRHQRYAHAKQFKRAGGALRTLRTYLGRTIREAEGRREATTSGARSRANRISRRSSSRPLYLAGRVLEQRQRQRGRKVYSLHAPEVECIGKGGGPIEVVLRWGASARPTRPASSASRSRWPQR